MKIIAAVAALLVAGSAWAGDGPRCESAYGRTACGYDCTAAYGMVQCARTPVGRCAAAYGRVTCWDPPRRLFRRYGWQLPKAECTSAYGQTACGYQCTAAYGTVKCASHPWARCEAEYGRVVCSDD